MRAPGSARILRAECYIDIQSTLEACAPRDETSAFSASLR
jgi:sRNA-binding carbon storage regulator CsrA